MPNDVAVAQYSLLEFQRDLSKTPEYQNMYRATDAEAMRIFCTHAMSKLGYEVSYNVGVPIIRRYPVAARFEDARLDSIRDVMGIEYQKVLVSRQILEMQFDRAARGVLSNAIFDFRNQQEVEDRLPATHGPNGVQCVHQRRLSDVRKAVQWVASASSTFGDISLK